MSSGPVAASLTWYPSASISLISIRLISASSSTIRRRFRPPAAFWLSVIALFARSRFGRF